MSVCKRIQQFLAAIAIFVCVSSPLQAAQSHWVGSWAASQQLVEPHNALSQDDLRDCTLRQIVHLSLGGTKVRVHLSNRFGTAPVQFISVHIARSVAAASSKIDAATDKTLKTYEVAPPG